IINNLYNFVELIDNNNCIFNIQKAKLILKLKEEYE
ncbi:DNA polymerase III, partial [Mycoplasma hominis]|nr:DNA polymerase III [Metamycoplasma hominis]